MAEYKLTIIGVVYYTRNNDPNHYNGEKFVASKYIDSTVDSFVPISNGVAVPQIDMNITQIYGSLENKEKKSRTVL